MTEERRTRDRDASLRSQDLERLIEERERLEAIIKRKFTRTVTVMFTDMKGSTSLAETEGDVATRYLLKKHTDFIAAAVRDGGGTLVKTMGDGTLSWFPEAPAAVRAAVGIQRHIAEFNRGRHGRPPLLVRVGMNTGTGIIEKDDIFGDVVNVAARFESLARPGEICISRSTNELLGDEFVRRFVRSAHLKEKKGLHQVFKVFWDEGDIERERAAAATPLAAPEAEATIALAPGARAAAPSPEALELARRLARLEKEGNLVEAYLLGLENPETPVQEVVRRIVGKVESADHREVRFEGGPALWFYRDSITIGRVPEADFPLTNKALSRVPVRFGVAGGRARLEIEARGSRGVKGVELLAGEERTALEADVEHDLGEAGQVVFSVCFPLEFRVHAGRLLVLRLLDPRECLRRNFSFTLEEVWRDFEAESSRLLVVGT